MAVGITWDEVESGTQTASRAVEVKSTISARILIVAVQKSPQRIQGAINFATRIKSDVSDQGRF
jgi:hypothetical protein